EQGKALYHYQRVAAIDPNFREVSSNVQRLAATTSPVPDPLPPSGGKAPNAPPPGALPTASGAARPRKVGYV
ncbi:MAG TPA: hypothetical protein VEU33_14335, partial [Archangium sp.]|nr:hypothetical protein [Archangium sp.]